MANVTLDPNDEFESAVMQVVITHRVKALEYGTTGNHHQNFYDIAESENISPLEACDVLLMKHQSTLKQWKHRGDATASYIDDAYLDRAVYAIISLVLYNQIKNDLGYDDADG